MGWWGVRGLAVEDTMDALNSTKINSTVTSGAKIEPKSTVSVELARVKLSLLWQEGGGALICAPL